LGATQVSESIDFGVKIESSAITPKPFLRWAGGKRKLIAHLNSKMPRDFIPKRTRVFEPFLGGGAFAFSLYDSTSPFFTPGRKLFLNDINPELVLAYLAVRDEPEKLISHLVKISRTKSKSEFEQVKFSTPRSDIARAARFIYLNRTCFNGIWRVNSDGKFNVPWGRLKNPRIFEEKNIYSCSDRLKGSKITNLEYFEATSISKKGDFVYFDPPYLPNKTSTMFSQYSKKGFGIEEHKKLSKVIKFLTDRGVNVMLSNSDTDLTRKIYGEVVNFHTIKVMRTISAAPESRGPTLEIIGTNY
jgi:DNA adenine methylase